LILGIVNFLWRAYEWRIGRRRRLRVRLNDYIISPDPDGSGQPGIQVDVVNTGSVPVTIRTWGVTNGNRWLDRPYEVAGQGLTDRRLEPADRAEEVLHYGDLYYSLGEEREIRALVALVDGKVFRSPWFRPSSHAKPVVLHRKILRRIHRYRLR
jgi:hypothetical protein